jgi:PAS domain S-box-containing protein
VLLWGIALLVGAYVLFLAGWWVIIIPPLFALVGSAIASNGYLLWENLKEYAHTLEQKVEERTLKLQQEIVERKQAELAVAESEARFRQLAEAAVEAIVITEQNTVVDVNEAFTQMFGYSLSETVGMRGSNLVSPDYREIVVQNIQSHYEGFYEIVCLRKDGTTFPAEIRAKVTTYGERVIRITSVRDISDRKRAEEASILEERNRIAREIHDTLAQALTGVIVHMEVAKVVVPEDSKARNHLIQAHNLARDGLAEARRSVWALRPQVLEQGGLKQALESLVYGLTAGTQIKCHYTIEETGYPLPSDVETSLLRIAQEALVNALKHAHANAVQVELTFASQAINLRVRDDGRGFNPELQRRKGFGLVGMRERIQSLGGQLTIDSQPGQGTEVIAVVPLASEILPKTTAGG